MSIAGGLQKAFDRGVAVGCDCLQIFVANQRRWLRRNLTTDEVSRYHDAHRKTRLEPVVAHASYLLNLASPDSAIRKRSIATLVRELERCAALGVSRLILHPGAHLFGTADSGIKRIARSLDKVARRTEGCPVTILLETTAGQGTTIGHRFEQLARIFDAACEPDRLGVCLDTCHLFAAGYDFRSPDGCASMVNQFDKLIGLARVGCIHMNDSKRELGSRVDRHQHIGKGKIGKAGLAHFLNERRFAHVPMILETPKGTDGRGSDLDKVNLKRLRSLIKTQPDSRR